MFENGSGRNERLYRGSSIDASYKVLDHLAKRFQRRRILKSANQKQEWPVVAMFINGSGRNEQSL
jgi:TnpA family transposase